MRLSRTDSRQRIVAELNRNFQEIAFQLENKDLRKLVSVLTTVNSEDYSLQFPIKHKVFLILAFTSWYIKEPWLREVVQYHLRESSRKRDIALQDRIDIILTDRVHALLYILESKVLGRNASEVFGNINGLKNEVYIRTKCLNSRKPKRLEFKRGYRDKGSRVLDNHGRDEILKDAILKEKQLSKEAELDSRPVRTQYCIGFIE